MKSSEYWQSRAVEIKLAIEKNADYLVSQLDKEYQKVSNSIEKDLALWYNRFAENNKITMAEASRLLNTRELKEFRWTLEDYIAAAKSADPQWQKALENASARFHISRLETIKIDLQQKIELLYGNQLDELDKLISESYQDGYYRTIYEVQRGVELGMSFPKVDPEKLRDIMSKPWGADGLTFSERIWKNRDKLVQELQSSLVQSVVKGEPLTTTSRALAQKMGVSRRNAARLVYTEQAYFTTRAQERSFRELGVEQYEIVETLDKHTCKVCQGLDGRVVPLSKLEPGVTAPPFHPRCRGVLVPWFEDLEGERAARNEEGTYYVPADMKYPEWKRKYVEG